MVNLISGKKLKLLLKRRRISSIELSRVLKISQSQISRYFNDDVAMPGTFIIKVAAYARLKLSDLIEGEIEEAQVIDMTPPPAIEAAEPLPTYERKPEPAAHPQPSVPPLVQVDVSALDVIIHELRTKLTILEQEIINIKHEMEPAHH